MMFYVFDHYRCKQSISVKEEQSYHVIIDSEFFICKRAAKGSKVGSREDFLKVQCFVISVE